MPCTFSYVAAGKVKGEISDKIKGIKLTKNNTRITLTDGSTTATINGNNINIINNSEDATLARFQANSFVNKLEKSGLTINSLEEESHKEELVVREMN